MVLIIVPPDGAGEDWTPGAALPETEPATETQPSAAVLAAVAAGDQGATIGPGGQGASLGGAS